jgi:hypothetical protein
MLAGTHCTTSVQPPDLLGHFLAARTNCLKTDQKRSYRERAVNFATVFQKGD